MKIAISTKDFLHLSGSRDFLRNLIDGVKLIEDAKVFILVDISLALSNNAKSDLNAIKQRIEALKMRVSLGVNEIGSNSDRENARGNINKLAFSLKERISLLLGADIVNGTQLLPYSGGEKGIDNVCNRNNIDIVIPTTFGLSTPFVSYLYDCQHKHFPNNFSPTEIATRDRYFSTLIEYSPAIIVNSRDVKKDLLNFFCADPTKIFSLPFAPHLSSVSLRSDTASLVQYLLPRKYFLVSNQFWIHKSQETTIKALRLLIDEGLTDLHIVFTGEMSEPRFPNYISSFFDLVHQLKLKSNTSFLGLVPKGHQLEIMKGAVAVLQPTLFEGGPGGGSIFDAEALGVRSIVSDIPINLELPISKRLVIFKAGDASSLANKMKDFWLTEYSRPSDGELMLADKARRSELKKCVEGVLNEATKSRNSLHRKIKINDTNSTPAKFTVITVVKNAAMSLGRTIESVLNQGYKNIEYIIVDGGSTDSTADVVKSFGSNIHYICEPDNGIYDAMNKGIRASTGDILYFLNSGDTLHDVHVFTDVASIVNNRNYGSVDFFYGNVRFVEEDGSDGRLLEYNKFPFFFYADNCQCHQVCFYRKRVFDLFGMYDTSFRVYGDQEFNARIVVRHNVKRMHLSRTIVRYLKGGFSSQMVITGLNFKEKNRIKNTYFGETPTWFFERLKEDYASTTDRNLIS